MNSSTFYNTNLPVHLRVLKDEIEAYAHEYGLDFFETIFEVVDADDLNEIAAYGGFPTRYPHWSFGMQYEELKKGYDYGLSKIYEMVINNDPCYAYLMQCNHLVDQKLVMAHVYGHCDFFKNNAFFAHTNRKMMDDIANHAAKIRDYSERFGEDEVESFIDRCMSIDDLIDIHSVAIKRRGEHSKYDFNEETNSIEAEPPRFKSKDYMDAYINPRERMSDEREPRKKQPTANFPDHPEKDVLLFLIEHAPLRNWQRDILSIIRDEAYYFTPQGQTKIMNEGWASYWHSTIMTQKVLQSSELIDYADHHSGTMAMSGGRLNPYKLGIELFRDIEERWNTGRFGSEYDDCDDLDTKRRWNRELGLGRKKIFEVRKIHNDITFIDTFLTPEFCHRHKLFSFGYNDSAEQYLIESREFDNIKKRLLFSLTNFGKPWIVVVNGNHRNRGELLLKHLHGGMDLKVDTARDTLANLQFMWNRPVHLETLIDGKPSLMSFDGNDHSTQLIGDNDDGKRKPDRKA
ncbi:SpoVR family protein [Telmatocola sphagniphila]|uniref:SpoVR family protein n=1 Tax=Telmatocola sphagniphila TaxID=1123043 RepID=A0A8E6B9X4_9BACT|nr:SpoVR family protein [Telmatocola sphagniphila]QVL33080.1 SpoVR family protein [Telmatocola sphagniphila]